MKKIVCLLLLTVTCYVNSQEMHYIPKVGINLATTTNTDGNIMPGLNVGMGFEFMLTPKFALEPGLYYSMQGADFPNINLKHDYLNIPILAKFYVTQWLSVFAGPQVGIKASSNKIAYGPDKYPGDYSAINYRGGLITEDISKAFDAAAVVGVGYAFLYGLYMSANVNIGLTNKLKSNFEFQTDSAPVETFNTGDASCKNLVFQFNFGYRF